MVAKLIRLTHKIAI